MQLCMNANAFISHCLLLHYYPQLPQLSVLLCQDPQVLIQRKHQNEFTPDGYILFVDVGPTMPNMKSKL